MVNISNILGSKYCDIIREDVTHFYKKLQYYENLLEEWFTCQKTWMYLENIFNGGGAEITKSMPNEAKKFQQIDQSWFDIMKVTSVTQIIQKTLTPLKDGSSYLDTFKRHNRDLDEIQKKLEEYLERKRGDFPRFYFLSNDELL